MTPEHAAWLLSNPLTDPTTGVEAYRRIDRQGDGALLVTVLAIDR